MSRVKLENVKGFSELALHFKRRPMDLQIAQFYTSHLGGRVLLPHVSPLHWQLAKPFTNIEKTEFEG